MTTPMLMQLEDQPNTKHPWSPQCEDVGCVPFVGAPESKPSQTLPTSSSARKAVPLCAGVLDYFPAALAAVARISKYGNDKHNPGEPLHWSRGKSADHADCIARHLIDRGIVDPETGESHTAELAWRALAMLQEEEEAKGAPQARGAY